MATNTSLVNTLKTIYLLFALTLYQAYQMPGQLKAWANFRLKSLANNLLIIHGPSGESSIQNQGFMNNPGIIIGKKGVIIVDSSSAYSVGKKSD